MWSIPRNIVDVLEWGNRKGMEGCPGLHMVDNLESRSEDKMKSFVLFYFGVKENV